MMFFLRLCILVLVKCVLSQYNERYRPQLHFSPPKNWMNDPNGLVKYNGIYHLFYQCNPYEPIFGPIHWCHAASTDLVHWCNLPIAIYPNELGLIFSGSAVVDKRNVTGFRGTNQQCQTLVAFFTQHFHNKTVPQLQQQSLAYSDDGGLKWNMYPGNPIIANPGIMDFRDPKVISYGDSYVMAIAAHDRVIFYGSKDLVSDWKYLSSFGENDGSHGGIWECPDLFELELNNTKFWVLIVSTNPGGPNGGSGTQYFIGNFDGQKFTNYNKRDVVLWLDWGPDNYAGNTWTDAGNIRHRKFIAWMSNWLYAVKLPTSPWRGQMTFVRNVALASVDNRIYVTSTPIPEIEELYCSPHKTFSNIPISCKKLIPVILGLGYNMYDVNITFDISKFDGKFDVCLSNANERMCISYLKQLNEFRIDRSKATVYNLTAANFTSLAKAKRISTSNMMQWRLIVDVSSVELFADGGLTSMTALFFPKKPLDIISVKMDTNSIVCSSKLIIKSATVQPLNSIWKSGANNCNPSLLGCK